MTSEKNLKVTDSSLPALFRSSDQDSINGQLITLKLSRTQLTFLVATALFAILAPLHSNLRVFFMIISALTGIFSLGITIAIQFLRPEKQWYAGRAIAESVKSLSWKFMVGGEPFLPSTDDTEAENQLIEKLQELITQGNRLGWSPSGQQSTGDQVTPAMRKIREMSMADRLEIYLSDRVLDQRNWYSNKAQQNAKASNMWFWITLSAQILTILTALFIVFFPLIQLELPAFFAAAATAVVAWTRLKQYKVNSERYAVASLELGLISAQSAHVDDDADLAKFVSDAETAMSREHTMWLARQDRTWSRL